MKKVARRVVSSMLAGAVLCSGTAFSAAATGKAQQPDLKLGVLSDVHISSRTAPTSAYFEKALKFYKDKGVDVILIAGDIADSGTREQIKITAEIFNKVFPDPATRPEKFFVPGNHDRGEGGYAQAKQMYEEAFGETDGASLHKVIKGYDFIGTTLGGDQTERLAFLKAELEKAVKRDPNKPIFYTQHEHLSNTVYGSAEWGDGNATYNVLKNSPQVITFSGHSHYTLIDERSIHQKDFTSLGTSTLSYMELEYGKANGSIPPNASNVKEGMYIEVFGDKVDIQRHSFFYDEELGENWVLDLPLTKASFTYTEDRAEAAPTFATGDQITVDAAKRNTVGITFPAASHPRFVHSYAITATEKTAGAKGKETLIFSDFYLGTSRMEDAVSWKVGGLKPETEYTIKVQAIESHGKRSAPLSVDVKTAASSQTVDPRVPSVLDVNFENGTMKDATLSNTKPQPVGNPKVVYDPLVRKNVLVLDGKSHVNYYPDEEQLGDISETFTLEAAFKMNKIAGQTIIESTQSAGIGFESTSSGKVEVWAMIGGSYKTLGVQLQAGEYVHLLATYDGQTLSLYQNGVLKGSLDASGEVKHNPRVPFALGADPDESGNGTLQFDGNIALVRIYSNAMTADDVAAVYQNYQAMCNHPQVTVDCSAGGTLSYFHENADVPQIEHPGVLKIGDSLYITAKADEGYTLKSLTVDGKAYQPGTVFAIGETLQIQAVFEKETTTMLGDVNNDGKISGVDALWVLESVAQTRTLSAEQLVLADVTYDTKVTGVDALRILEYVAKIIPDFPKPVPAEETV